MEDPLASNPNKTPWIRLAILVGIAVAIGWAWHHPALWPLKVTVVLFHELGHAVATWATGGSVESITLSPMEGGLTMSRGGARLIILNAGYLGSLLAGVGLMASTKVPLLPRILTAALAVGLMAVTWVLIPWFTFGFWFTGGTAVVFGLLAAVLPGVALRWVLRGLGVFSILYAALDVWSDIFARALDTSVVSDAVMLQQATGIPSLVWGGAWVIAGAVLLVIGRRWLV